MTDKMRGKKIQKITRLKAGKCVCVFGCILTCCGGECICGELRPVAGRTDGLRLSVVSLWWQKITGQMPNTSPGLPPVSQLTLAPVDHSDPYTEEVEE